MKTALILGAGLVVKPIVEYLEAHDVHVIVASRTLEKMQKKFEDLPKTQIEQFDIQKNPEKLDQLIPQADVVISLLPYKWHLEVAKHCLKHKKHLVTTSYVKEEMKALHQKAEENGLIFLNEVGLDPGIDHMEAMRIIHDIRAKNGKILSFTSYAGGLPAPEANTNPFFYKLSWSPRGFILAGTNRARYLKDGKIVEVEGKDLFKHCIRREIDDLGTFEVYPNRDSLPYIDLYGIKEVKTMIRGTIRNIGHCKLWRCIGELGLLSLEEMTGLSQLTFAEFVARLIHAPDASNIKQKVAQYLNLPVSDEVIDKLEWLGLFDEQRHVPVDQSTPLDVLTILVEEKLQYSPGERDMIILEHEFIADYSEHTERIRSYLINYGIPNGDSAMARTVSLPAAIATRLIMEGKITEVGVQIPTKPDIYLPILEELKKMGIEFKTKVESLPKAS